MWDKGSSWTGLSQDSKVEIEEDKVHRHGDTEQVEGTKQCVYEEVSLQFAKNNDKIITINEFNLPM